MKRKLELLFLSLLFLTIVSCHDKEREFPKPQPEPELYVEYVCPKAGDIYKIWPDTFLFNKKSEIYALEGDKMYAYNSAAFMLGTCEGEFHERNKAVNSPLSWEIKTGKEDERDTVWATRGTIYLKQILFMDDIDRILEFKDGEKMDYDVALLNFNKDTIQENTITFIYKPDLQKP